MKYTLHKKAEEKRDKFIVTIKADSKDADYITTEEEYSKADFDQWVVDALIDLIKNYSERHLLTDYNNTFDLDIPFNGWDGNCHSLEKVTVQYVDSNGEIWEVKLNLD